MKGIVKRSIFRYRFTTYIFCYGHFFPLGIVIDISRHIKQTEDQSKKRGMSTKWFQIKFISLKKMYAGAHAVWIIKHGSHARKLRSFSVLSRISGKENDENTTWLHIIILSIGRGRGLRHPPLTETPLHRLPSVRQLQRLWSVQRVPTVREACTAHRWRDARNDSRRGVLGQWLRA